MIGKTGLSGWMHLARLMLLAAAVTSAIAAKPLDKAELDHQSAEILKSCALRFNPPALRRAIQDLSASFDTYTQGPEFLVRLDQFEKLLPGLMQQLAGGDVAQMEEGINLWHDMLTFQRDALLSNPLLDFERLVFIRQADPQPRPLSRVNEWTYWSDHYNLSFNWSCDFGGGTVSRIGAPPVLPGWDTELHTVAIHQPGTPVSRLFKPQADRDLKHLELSFAGDKVLFSMAGTHDRWQVHELKIDGTGLRQVNPGTEPDVDNGDACYLPDGRIVFNSTRGYVGVPCQDGHSIVANLCLMNADGSGERMLTFDQESNFHPSVLNDGRILYMRYEYANVSHQFPGILFHMNPDGTRQSEYYGSNSYWPNRVFSPTAIPGHPTLVAGIVTGHHAAHKVGKLVLFDPVRGRMEAQGAVQAIPGYGKPVKPVVQDGLYANDWPKFTHPHPLNEKYFLVSAKLSGDANFSLWLVDIFDNMTLIKEMPGHNLFDPIPIKPTPRPAIIPDKVRLDEKSATVYLQDVYLGQAMAGVPRGMVKSLRIFSYNYVYRNRAMDRRGHLATPGVDGPWEPRYLLGTVPVAADGSALFEVPANTPVAVQPIDAEGRALQLMRSWFTGMPGEFVSCVGCHEPQNSTPLAAITQSSRSRPSLIKPWRGPARGFDFEREVQPVLDKFCVGCHGPTADNGIDLTRKTAEEKRAISTQFARDKKTNISTVFTPSYLALQALVYRPHAESCYRPQVAMEFFADKSPLVQLLKKGHHNVKLDSEAWDRLYTWIDLSAPDHGTWSRFSDQSMPNDGYQRRAEALAAYGGVKYEYEKLPPVDDTPIAFVAPAPLSAPAAPPACHGWPFDAAAARQKQAHAGLPLTRTIKLDNGKTIDFALIPAGAFIMGDKDGPGDERNTCRVAIEKPFYMSVREISNEELTAIQPDHNSGKISYYSIDWRADGYDANEPRQPAVRVSWNQAVAFCKALSGKSGERIVLPTEAQWEWACRAGAATPMWYGPVTAEFSAFENLADATLAKLAFGGKAQWFRRDDQSNDKHMISTGTGSYTPNPWGLFDMHGNAGEWTLSDYKPYPYVDNDGRNAANGTGAKVVRGGSWWELPKDATSASRRRYTPFEKIYNVGFRVVMDVEADAQVRTR